jgi:NAD(P)-dependent dehydrogenase (short-subunit alcohol dehydrogenase family)
MWASVNQVMRGKVVVITGATSGIGQVAAPFRTSAETRYNGVRRAFGVPLCTRHLERAKSCVSGPADDIATDTSVDRTGFKAAIERSN